MKNEKITFIAGIAAMLFAASAVTFVSCNKDEEYIGAENTPTGIHVKSAETLVLGYCHSGSEDITLSFNKNKFLDLYQEAITDSLGANYIVNDISIHDERPRDMEKPSTLCVSIFDVDSAITHTEYLLIEKEEDTNNDIRYTVNSAANRNKITVVCSGTNCQGGCWINDKSTGCTPCENAPVGICNSEVAFKGKTSAIAIEVIKMM